MLSRFNLILSSLSREVKGLGANCFVWCGLREDFVFWGLCNGWSIPIKEGQYLLSLMQLGRLFVFREKDPEGGDPSSCKIEKCEA